MTNDKNNIEVAEENKAAAQATTDGMPEAPAEKEPEILHGPGKVEIVEEA